MHSEPLHSKKEKTGGRSLAPMAAEDLDGVLRIEEVSYPKPWSRAQFESELRNPVSHPFVLKVSEGGKERLAGYIIFWVVYGEAHILNIAVHPDFRRRHLATWMMETAFSLMDEYLVYYVFLEVRRSNTGALDLYRKLGFKESYERKNYYGDEDAIVMTLFL